MELKGKCAIVTGGAMGIGFATANLLLQEGCNVTIWDINEATLTKSRAALRHPGVNVFARLCDVTDKSQVYESAKQAIMDMGRIDILVNNAGFVKGGEVLAQPDADVVAGWHSVGARAGQYGSDRWLWPESYPARSG